MSGDVLHSWAEESQSEIDRLCAEVEALRACLSEHLRAAVACQNSVIETRGTDGMDRLSFANDKARALLAQPAGPWVNPLAAEVEKLRADAERYAHLKSIAKVGITKRQEFVITLDLVPCPGHIGMLDLALDADRNNKEPTPE